MCQAQIRSLPKICVKQGAVVHLARSCLEGNDTALSCLRHHFAVLIKKKYYIL